MHPPIMSRLNWPDMPNFAYNSSNFARTVALATLGALAIHLSACTSDNTNTATKSVIFDRMDIVPYDFQFAPAGEPRLEEWRKEFAQRVVESGRSPEFVKLVLDGISPIDRYLFPKKAGIGTGIEDQLEFATPIWEYVAKLANKTRRRIGKTKLTQHEELFDGLEERFGVNREVLISIWGMETNFGTFIGSEDAANVLANMAAEGRRRKLAESELIAVIKLLELGLVKREDLISGWAGAMGQTQFMPSSVLAYAVDFDEDGKLDIWKNPADALASAARYLAQYNYEFDKPWGVEVDIQSDFDFSLANGSFHNLDYWNTYGVKNIDGSVLNLTDEAGTARLWLPAGATGPKFLLFKNFNVFMKYNRSESYAFSVGLLSNHIAGLPDIKGKWPTDIRPLSVAGIKRLQNALATLGYYPFGIDGIAGRGTKAGIQKFQKENGLLADGYPTIEVLARLEEAANQ